MTLSEAPNPEADKKIGRTVFYGLAFALLALYGEAVGEAVMKWTGLTLGFIAWLRARNLIYKKPR